MELIKQYRVAVEDLTEAKAHVAELEKRVRELENRLEGRGGDAAVGPELPSRFDLLLKALRKRKAPARLTDIAQDIPTLTIAGVRAQLVYLMEKGHVRQVGRLYELKGNS